MLKCICRLFKQVLRKDGEYAWHHIVSDRSSTACILSVRGSDAHLGGKVGKLGRKNLWEIRAVR